MPTWNQFSLQFNFFEFSLQKEGSVNVPPLSSNCVLLPSALPTESLCLCVDVLNEKGAEEGCSSVATTAQRARVECESETKNKTVL
jgi:hypothetical protein